MHCGGPRDHDIFAQNHSLGEFFRNLLEGRGLLALQVK
jgi:hypothetical protein